MAMYGHVYEAIFAGTFGSVQLGHWQALSLLGRGANARCAALHSLAETA